MTNKISEIRITDELIKLIKNKNVNITKHDNINTNIRYIWYYRNYKVFHCYNIIYITNDTNNPNIAWDIWKAAGTPTLMVIVPSQRTINAGVPIYNKDVINTIERALENAIKSKNQDDSYENFLSLMEGFDKINKPVHSSLEYIDLPTVGTFSVRVNTTNITLYDVYGSDIVYKESTGFEYHREYNDEGQCIYYRDSDDTEEWYNNGKCIHCKDSTGEHWYNSNMDEITKEKYDVIYNVNELTKTIDLI